MRDGGAIVNVSSIQALTTATGIGTYAAAKAALNSLTRTAAIEGHERNLRAKPI
jgi:NAD(P)-dependent dehydrogenase (short-subunit alcohol dehydrogenase family)